MTNNNLKYIISFILAIFFIVFAILFYKKNQIENRSQTQNTNTVSARDWAAEASKLPKNVEAKRELAAKNYQKAYELFKEASQSTTDLNVRSTLDISAANTFMNIDREKAANEYIEIASNQNYPDVSRGFALLQLSQFYYGNKDITVLNAYFKDKQGLALDKKGMENRLDTDIYSLYPYGIAAARLATYEIQKTKSTTTALEMFQKYNSSIDKNIAEMRGYEGMEQLIPNTYMAKAQLYRNLYRYGVVTKNEVISLYEKADAETKAQNNKISAQFNMLRYADFLVEAGNNESAQTLLSMISSAGVQEMVTRNLSNVEEAQNDYQYLATLVSKNKIVKDFFAQFGWK